MNATQQNKAERFEVIRNAFPGSRSVPDAALKGQIDRAWKKGLHYGLSGGDELGSYVIAAYVLGENFDRDIPQAAAVLQDTASTGPEKIEWLEAFTEDALQALRQPEGKPAAEDVDAGGVDARVQAMLAEEAARPADGNAADTTDPYHEYYEVQRVSQPYRLVAYWAVDKLRKGDLEAILQKFSSRVIREVGRPKVEAILREKVIPFFQASLDVTDEVEVGKMQLPSNGEGYGFFMHLVALRRTKPLIGTKPFSIAVVRENGQLLIASVDVDQEAAQPHE